MKKYDGDFQSNFQKKIKKIINDSKRFNTKVDEFIKKTERHLSLPPVKVNKGVIRKLKEQDLINQEKRTAYQNELKYKQAKFTYEKNMHDIMEKIIEAKKNFVL
tara:strand:- start:173 stop:484 length:312 start_codon:yes stop_codon:yes gene_type:complete